MSGAKAYYPVMPTTQYVQTMPQVSYVQAAPQQVSYTPTTYAADPMFFNFGRYFNNNIGGKVLLLSYFPIIFRRLFVMDVIVVTKLLTSFSFYQG